MTTLANSFEGGTSGTTLTTGNTGGASGNAFDAINAGAGGATIAFDSTQAAHGTLSCKIATATPAGTPLAEWTTSMGTQATVWYRQYLYLTGNPGTAIRVYVARAGGSLAGAIGISTTGKIQLVNGSSGIPVTFTGAIPLNQWFRIEGYITGNASTGALNAALYSPQDSTIATETHTVTGQNTTGTLTQYWFGEQVSLTNVGPFWMDDLGISSTGPLGPVVTAHAPRGTSIVPSLIAAGAI